MTKGGTRRFDAQRAGNGPSGKQRRAAPWLAPRSLAASTCESTSVARVGRCFSEGGEERPHRQTVTPRGVTSEGTPGHLGVHPAPAHGGGRRRRRGRPKEGRNASRRSGGRQGEAPPGEHRHSSRAGGRSTAALPPAEPQPRRPRRSKARGPVAGARTRRKEETEFRGRGPGSEAKAAVGRPRIGRPPTKKAADRHAPHLHLPPPRRGEGRKKERGASPRADSGASWRGKIAPPVGPVSP